MHTPRRLRGILVAATLAAVVIAPTLPSMARAFDIPSDWLNFIQMKGMRAMHAIDLDKDGFVTKEEFMKFQEQFFDRMDKDKDGKLTPEEWLGRKPTKKDN